MKAGMQESIQLSAHRPHHPTGAVTHIKTPESAGEIEQPVAIDIFQDRTLGTRDKYRCYLIGASGNRLRTTSHQFPRTWAWDGSSQLNGRHFSTTRGAAGSD